MPLGANTPGIEGLTDVIFSAVQEQLNSQPRVLDFGVIQYDWSLKCNAYPMPVPKESYLICRSVALPTHEWLWTRYTEAQNKPHTHKYPDEDMFEQNMEPVACNDVLHIKSFTVKQIEHNHEYDVARPSERHLAPGHHVLVAWVGNDPVVVDVLFSVDAAFRRYGGEANW